ncbi:hypothetical protein ACQJBY_030747 [Aegilops geniculata]
MMEDPPSSLHRHRRCRFCFCCPLAQGSACPLLLRLLLLLVFKALLLLPSCGWLRCCSTMPSSATHRRRQLLLFRATAACMSPSSRPEPSGIDTAPQLSARRGKNKIRLFNTDPAEPEVRVLEQL